MQKTRSHSRGPTTPRWGLPNSLRTSDLSVSEGLRMTVHFTVLLIQNVERAMRSGLLTGILWWI